MQDDKVRDFETRLGNKVPRKGALDDGISKQIRKTEFGVIKIIL